MTTATIQLRVEQKSSRSSPDCLQSAGHGFDDGYRCFSQSARGRERVAVPTKSRSFFLIVQHAAPQIFT